MTVYAELLPKPRWFARHMSDVVPWRAVAAPGVILHKQTHALQRSYLMRGPDLSTEVQEVQGALMLQANNVFKRLGGAWTVHCEAQRLPVTTYPDRQFPSQVATLIDDERRRAMLVEPGSFETTYYLTLTWQPPSIAKKAWLPVFVSGTANGNGHGPQASLSDFVTQADYLIYLLRGMLAMARPLSTDETLTYLHSCVSDRWHPVAYPELPVDVDVMVCDTSFRGGWYPRLGRYHLRVCSIQSYPPTSMADAIRAIDHRGFPYRRSCRWIAYERQSQDYLLSRVQKQWVGQEKGAFTRIGELMSRKDARVINTTATNKAEDTDEARQEVGADIIAYGDFTSTVTVWDEDPAQADAKLRDVMQILDSRGFITIAEKEHATAAWLSSMPGNRADSVRRTPHHSLTFAHLAPGLSAAWTGPERDEHLKQGPWFLAHTEGSTLFRVVNHTLDNGHFKVVGPTRSGKSVLAAVMVASWLQYEGAQVSWWDIDGSARCLTLCLGGHYHHIGEDGVGFQPYVGIHDEVELAWAFEWTLDLLASEKVPLTEVVHRYVSRSLRQLAQRPVRERTITGLLRVMVERPAELELMRPKQSDLRNSMDLERSGVRRALEDYTVDGAHGGLLDACEDQLGEGWLHTFEQKTLLAMPRMVKPITTLLFHQQEQRFDTRRPMLVMMDDAAVTWAFPDYEEKGKKWMVTTAKKNVSLGFFTHSLTQVFESKLGGLLIESCPATFALPNPAARTPKMAAIYEQMGFNTTEVSMIASLRPQRDLYYANDLVGKRSCSLLLSPLILALCARNTQDDHALMDEVLAKHGREGFAAAWVEAQGFPEQAAWLRTQGRVDELLKAEVAV